MLDNLFKKKPKSILIVDDCKTVIKRIAREIRNFLTENGLSEDEDYTIDTFSSVTEYKINRKPKYDITFIDWNIGRTNVEFGSAIIDDLEDHGRCDNNNIYTGQDQMSFDILRYRAKKKRVGFIYKDFATDEDLIRIFRELSEVFSLKIHEESE